MWHHRSKVLPSRSMFLAMIASSSLHCLIFFVVYSYLLSNVFLGLCWQEVSRPPGGCFFTSFSIMYKQYLFVKLFFFQSHSGNISTCKAVKFYQETKWIHKVQIFFPPLKTFTNKTYGCCPCSAHDCHNTVCVLAHFWSVWMFAGIRTDIWCPVVRAELGWSIHWGIGIGEIRGWERTLWLIVIVHKVYPCKCWYGICNIETENQFTFSLM